MAISFAAMAMAIRYATMAMAIRFAAMAMAIRFATMAMAGRGVKIKSASSASSASKKLIMTHLQSV